MNWLILKFFILIFSLTISNPVKANSIEEFAARSQTKDALLDGDCQKWGGAIRGLPKNPILTLEKHGERLGGYRNVLRYQGAIYVLYSVPKKGILNYLSSERKLVICKFGP